jgi:Ca2+:H+ antiporter
MMHPHPPPAADGVGSFFKGSYTMLTGNRLYILLLFVPIALVSEEFFESEAIIFSLCCFAILPLAALLGDATEQTALHTSQTIGGLLNATFGNATEMIICFFLLKAGQLEVVKLSLLGSILSNALLVLGFACLASGSVKRNVVYGSTTATANTTMLQVSVIGVILPTLMTATGQFESHGNESLSISRFISVIFLFLYALFLINTLCPCPALKPGEEENKKEAEEGEEEESYLGFWGSILWLLGATLVLAYLSELLSGAVEGAAEGMGLTPAFVGFVIIPIIGNAAEHSTAVVMAFRLKMDLALAVAQGSSTQIALFVVPVMVLLGWLIGQPLDLDFGLFESAVSTCGKYLGSALRMSLSTLDSY